MHVYFLGKKKEKRRQWEGKKEAVHFISIQSFFSHTERVCAKAVWESSAWGNIAFIIKYKGVLVTFPLRVYSNELSPQSFNASMLLFFLIGFDPFSSLSLSLFGSLSFFCLYVASVQVVDDRPFSNWRCSIVWNGKQNMLLALTHTHTLSSKHIFISSLNT